MAQKIDQIEFKAAVLRSVPDGLSLEKIEFNSLAHGQVMVRLEYSGICRSQLMEMKGLRGHDKWLPHLLGHEGVGIVLDVGAGVNKVNKGDRVILSWINGSGISSQNANYVSAKGMVNSGPVTTFSEITIVSENKVTVAPEGLSLKLCALMGCALPTGMGMVLKQAKVRPKQKIAVIGLGGIGLSCLLALKAMGIEQVWVYEKNVEKVEKSREIIKSILISDDNLDEVKNSFDYVFEAGGLIETIELGFSLICNKGTLIFASHPEKGHQISLDPHELIKGKKIYGSWGGDVYPDVDFPKFSEVLSKLDFDFTNLMCSEYRFDDIHRAISDFENGDTPRPLLRFF